MAKRKYKPPVDFFGNIIEIGDAYFYGGSPCAGKVIEIGSSWIVIEYAQMQQVFDDSLYSYVDTERIKKTMRCASPDKGVCLDKTYDKEIV